MRVKAAHSPFFAAKNENPNILCECDANKFGQQIEMILLIVFRRGNIDERRGHTTFLERTRARSIKRNEMKQLKKNINSAVILVVRLRVLCVIRCNPNEKSQLTGKQLADWKKKKTV